MRINTNVASLQAQEANKNTNNSIGTSLEKLGTGLRINKAADDASGLAIADKLRTQATSITQGIANGNSASALIQIADKAMAEQSNILDTVKAKLIQAATATTTEAGREAIRKDISKLLTQFDDIATQTNYNGITLLQKDQNTTTVQDTLTFQLGEDRSFDVSLSASKASNTVSLGGGSDAITDNSNLEGGESIFIRDTGATVLSSVRVAADGTDTSASAGLNISLSGDLSTAFTATDGDITLTATNETEATKALLQTIGDNVSTATYAADVLTISAGSSVDLSQIDFSAVTLGSATTSATATVTNTATSSGFSVANLNTNTDGHDQVNLDTTSATGGDLLSSIKNLAADGLTNLRANEFMTTVDEAITQLNDIRADFGSSQNQVESSIRNMQTTVTNLEAAESVIRDVDYAAESAKFNKQNIIAQAGTYAMSQANAVSQNVLRLLQ